MATLWTISALCCLFAVANAVLATQHCLYYDDTECEPPKTCNRTIQCDSTNAHGTRNCFSSWKNDSGVIKILKRGCWSEKSCSSTSECIGERHLDVYFCCCAGDYCNKNISNITTIRTTPMTGPNPSGKPNGSRDDNSDEWTKVILYYILVPIFGLVIMVAVLFYLWSRHKSNVLRKQPLIEPMQPMPPEVRYQHPVDLIEVVAQGQFGCVWKAESMGRKIAVKIISPQDKSSWITERDMYTLYNINHECVLKFVGSDCKGDGMGMEYWLMTEFHENGCLSAFLKANTVSWKQLLHLCISMVKGLAYLHSDVIVGDLVKPSIAHRDLKSKNVLVKNDLTCCISDLGLAIAFENESSSEEARAQVGTNRYMAPEVLEGAITFHRESFMRIDIYALALVLWEVVSRCSIGEEAPPEYSVPFESDVGQRPSIADMQVAVVERKIRPKIDESWRGYAGMSTLCDTIEDCWDQDADARLTAQCVHERLLEIREPNQSKAVFVPLLNSTGSMGRDEQRSSSGVSSCSLTDGRDSMC